MASGARPACHAPVLPIYQPCCVLWMRFDPSRTGRSERNDRIRPFRYEYPLWPASHPSALDAPRAFPTMPNSLRELDLCVTHFNSCVGIRQRPATAILVLARGVLACDGDCILPSTSVWRPSGIARVVAQAAITNQNAFSMISHARDVAHTV